VLVLWSNYKVEAEPFADGEFRKLQTVLTGLGEIFWSFIDDFNVNFIWYYSM